MGFNILEKVLFKNHKGQTLHSFNYKGRCFLSNLEFFRAQNLKGEEVVRVLKGLFNLRTVPGSLNTATQ